MQCENGHHLAQVRCVECGRRCVVEFSTAVRVSTGRSFYVCAVCAQPLLHDCEGAG